MQIANLADNRIVSLRDAFTGTPLLQRLDLSSNHLEHVPTLPFLPLLATLNISDNPLRALPPFILQPHLSSLNLSFCQLHDDVRFRAVHALPSLRQLQLNDNARIVRGQRSVAVHTSTTRVEPVTLPWLQELNHTEVDSTARVASAHALLSAHPVSLLALRRSILGLDGPSGAGGKGGMHSCTLQSWKQGLLRPWAFMGRTAGPPTNDRQIYALFSILLRRQAEALDAADRTCAAPLRCLEASFENVAQESLPRLSAALRAAQDQGSRCHDELTAWNPSATPPLLRCNTAFAARRAIRSHTAARAIQSAWRTHRWRADHTAEHRSAAATLLQATARGMLTRRQGKLNKWRTMRDATRIHAATWLQAACRGWLVRLRLARARSAASGVGGTDEELQTIGDDFLPFVEGLEDSDNVSVDGITFPQYVPAAMRKSLSTTGSIAMPPLPAPNPARLLSSVPVATASIAAHSPLLLQKFRSKQLQRSESLQAPPSSVDAPQPPHPCRSPTPSEFPLATCSDTSTGHPKPPSACYMARRQVAVERHARRIEALQQEWGFKDSTTAEVYLKSQKHVLRSRTQKRQLRRLTDPDERLQVRLLCAF
jgi:hypothetical protein